MNKTFRTSFALKNTYRVNSILFSLKQIPLIKRLLPSALYGSGGLKTFANIVSAIIEIFSAFIWKLAYFGVAVYGIGILYQSAPKDAAFLHILIFLSIAGAFLNTYMFDPSKDKYYAVILMRMNAREYALTNYGYFILKLIIGSLPFAVIFGMMSGVPLWMCILVPFFAAGLKMTVTALSLHDFKKSGSAMNGAHLDKLVWGLIAVLVCLAYGLPASGIILPLYASAGLMLLCVISGIISAYRIIAFKDYKLMYKWLLADTTADAAVPNRRQAETSRRAISADITVTSNKKGLEYLNELFIKRHRNILWRASKGIALVCAVLFMAAAAAVSLNAEIKSAANRLIMTFLPYFAFIMYAINRGTSFTQALFMNCDRSLLSYSFYKKPGEVLRLFAIRLREIIKVNLLPAVIIGAGLAATLFLSGGTDNIINYAVVFVSIVCMSIFFSVHYLTIYYLLQPYNAATELKSGTYKIVVTATYLVCWYMMRLRMPTLVFGIATIVFCVLYCIIACILVYRLAPKTFRIRT